jgi:hypothetical protein
MQSESIAQYTIRVTSARPGTEIPVVGAVYFGGSEGDLRILRENTPFEVPAPARVVGGMLRTMSVDAPVLVEILRAEESTIPPERVSMARGRTVLLGEQLTHGVSRFIRTAP